LVEKLLAVHGLGEADNAGRKEKDIPARERLNQQDGLLDLAGVDPHFLDQRSEQFILRQSRQQGSLGTPSGMTDAAVGKLRTTIRNVDAIADGPWIEPGWYGGEGFGRGGSWCCLFSSGGTSWCSRTGWRRGQVGGHQLGYLAVVGGEDFRQGRGKPREH